MLAFCILRIVKILWPDSSVSFIINITDMRSFTFILFLTVAAVPSCVESEPDFLGDILVRVLLDEDQIGLRTTTFGVFPTEVLVTKEFVEVNATKTAVLEEGQILIPDILPGVYVVSTLSQSEVSIRQTVQVVADEVTLLEFDFRNEVRLTQ